MRRHADVPSVLLGESTIGPEAPFDFPQDRRLVTLQYARHLDDRAFCKPPDFVLAAFLKRKLRAPYAGFA